MSNNNAQLNSKLSAVQAMLQTGRMTEAMQSVTMLAKAHPRNVNVLYLQGVVHGSAGNNAAAIDSFRQVVKLKPKHSLAHFNLGNALVQNGNMQDAITSYNRALKLEPGKFEIINALAKACAGIGNFKKAIELYRRAIKIQPHNADAYGNLAASYFQSSDLVNACKYYQQAISRQNKAHFYDGLGAALCQQGKYTESIEAHQNALKLEPGSTRYHSNMLLSMNYIPTTDAEALLKAHRGWGEAHAVNNQAVQHFSNETSTGRRLRVGYVSPDFRTHSVAYFFEPLLENHNELNVETYCYACSPHQDETTLRLMKHADHWRNISTLADEQVVAGIRNDKIDILVDLSGHTANNRLTLFAARPAPVQLTWLGYPGTTGLDTVDYRLTDHHADAPNNDVNYTEQLVRLDGCFLCYKAPLQTPSIKPCPVSDNDFITFGSFNNLAKINKNVIQLWSELLLQLPASRILIKNPSLSDAGTARRYMEMFASHGVAADRVELLGLAATTDEHLDTYNRIDIALDTFPYNGTTTTCEALYMGTPVITLSGDVHASRVSESLLASIGLEQYVAKTPDAYIDCAKALANDVASLKALNADLRERMLESSLCDGQAFAYKIEQAYRDMWSAWCVAHSEKSD